MPRSYLSLAHRVRRLEDSFPGTQKELAESLGVSARTIRRWKNRTDVEMPRTDNPGRASQLSKRIEKRFRKLDYSKFRRRERYYFHERPETAGEQAVDRGEVELPPRRPLAQIDPDTQGLLEGTVAAFNIREKESDHPRLEKARQEGEKIAFDVRYLDEPIDADPREEDVFVVDARGLTKEEFYRRYFRIVRDMIERIGSPPGVNAELTGAYRLAR